MRVATRRLRSAFRTYRKILDRGRHRPDRRELKWLAAELGVDRDQEVLAERLTTRIDALPGTLLLGPVRGRLRTLVRRPPHRLPAPAPLAVLDWQALPGPAAALDALLAGPPLLPAAPDGPRDGAARGGTEGLRPPRQPRRPRAGPAARRRSRPRHARGPQGRQARPVRGRRRRRPGARPARRRSSPGGCRPYRPCSATTRTAWSPARPCATLAARAHAAGESAFTWGLLYEQGGAATAAERERELPLVWAKASAPGLLSALGG